jgi:hypothetical protein
LQAGLLIGLWIGLQLGLGIDLQVGMWIGLQVGLGIGLQVGLSWIADWLDAVDHPLATNVATAFSCGRKPTD